MIVNSLCSLLACLIAGLVPVKAAAASAWGGETGNGGDSIDCRELAGSQLSGVESLDYVYAISMETAERKITPVQDARASLEAIANRIESLGLAMGTELKQFTLNYFVREPTASRVWKPRGDFPTLNDQQIDFAIPENCLDPMTGQAAISQVVIRVMTPQVTFYNYSPLAMNSILLRPASLSFLLLHEFLWDYSDDPKIIRRVNFLLHSSSLSDPRNSEATSELAKLSRRACTPFNYLVNRCG